MPKKRPQREGIMLAYPAEKGRVARLGNEFFMQPKLRGERARVDWFHGEPVLISSYGNEFKFLNHIKEDLRKIKAHLGFEVAFDGELYNHNWTQQEISAILRSTVNKHPNTEYLQYHIFDIADTVLDQWQRFTVLADYAANDLFRDTLFPVPYLIATQKNWMNMVNSYLDLGYEGGILRAIHAKWEAKRTVNMLKYKPTEKDEYIITSVNEAIDEAGIPKGMIGSFTVRDEGYTRFKVGAGKLSHEERIELWHERANLYGKTLIVKHEPIKTKGGVPICAVAVDIKEE